MDSRQIENFLAVYEARSMRVAARQRYVSEQGLSKSIRTLEAELGSALFERTRTGVVPTAAGRYFHEYAVGARDAAARMKADLGVLADGRHELRLPCSYGALHRAYGVLHRFEESRPQIHIHWLDLDDVRAERMVEAGEAPFGLLVRSPGPSSLEFVPLYSCPQALLVPSGHPLCQKERIGYRDLEGVPLAFEGSDFHVNRLLMTHCLEAGFVPDIAAETSDLTLCMRLAALGECCSVVPSFIMDEWPHAGLCAIPFADNSYVWELGLAWTSGHAPEGDAAELASYLVEHRAEMGSA